MNLCALLVVLESACIVLVDLQFLSASRLCEAIVAARVVVIVVKQGVLGHVGKPRGGGGGCLLEASVMACVVSALGSNHSVGSICWR